MDTNNTDTPTTDDTAPPTPDELITLLKQGVAYCRGDGVEKDETKGKSLIREAIDKGVKKLAAQGNAEAQYRIGECYYYGWGVYRIKAGAVKWYRKAAEQGHAKAQYALGWCYDNGDGVPKDEAKAARWYRLAAEQGHAEAQYALGECYYYGKGVRKKPPKPSNGSVSPPSRGVQKLSTPLDSAITNSANAILPGQA